MWIGDMHPDVLVMELGAGLGHCLSIFKQTIESHW